MKKLQNNITTLNSQEDLCLFHLDIKYELPNNKLFYAMKLMFMRRNEKLVSKELFPFPN